MRLPKINQRNANHSILTIIWHCSYSRSSCLGKILLPNKNYEIHFGLKEENNKLHNEVFVGKAGFSFLLERKNFCNCLSRLLIQSATIGLITQSLVNNYLSLNVLLPIYLFANSCFMF